MYKILYWVKNTRRKSNKKLKSRNSGPNVTRACQLNGFPTQNWYWRGERRDELGGGGEMVAPLLRSRRLRKRRFYKCFPPSDSIWRLLAECACVSVWVCVLVCEYMCLCVWERNWERESRQATPQQPLTSLTQEWVVSGMVHSMMRNGIVKCLLDLKTLFWRCS